MKKKLNDVSNLLIKIIPELIICSYKLTNYNDKILIGAYKGKIIAIENVESKLNLNYINVNKILTGAEGDIDNIQNYDLVNTNTGFCTKSNKILVDHGFETCIGICTTVNNMNCMSHLYPHEYKNDNSPTIKSWIDLITENKIKNLIIFGKIKNNVVTLSIKLQNLLQSLNIKLYILMNYDAYDKEIFIGINNDKLVIFKKKQT